MIYEKHDAVVASNADENKSGRIKVSCYGLLGDEDSVLPMWIEPNFDWGWFYVPDVGETVEIEIAVGSEHDESKGQTSLDTPNISWRGKRRWTSEEMDGQNEPRPIPEIFLENYGKRRGFVTPAGHTLLFDDTEGKERVELSRVVGDAKQTILFNEDGGVVVTDADEQTFLIEKDLIKLEGGSVIKCIAPEINLGENADSAVPRGDQLVTHIDSHTHPTPMGPSGAPLLQTPADALSTISKVE